MITKKFVFAAAALVICMIFSAVSCDKSSSDNQNTRDGDSGSENIFAEDSGPDRENTPDSVPSDLKFDGKTFTVLSREESIWNAEMGVEEENGDIVNDAVYKRNKTAEGRFDITVKVVKIPGVWGQEANFNNNVKNSVKAGDNAYDLIAGYAYFFTPLAAEGFFLNWKKIPHVDFGAPWWAADLSDKMTIDGKLYFMSGDLSLSFTQKLMCLFFSKQIQQNYDIEDLYQVVLGGKWTYDKFYDTIKNIYTDLNGNGKKDDEDLFGFVTGTGNGCDQFFVSQNQPITKKNADGYPELIFNSPKTIKITENMIDLFYENPGAFAEDEGKTGTHVEMFKSGRVFTMFGDLSFTENFRDMDDDYGVLPYPKFDEAQDKYAGLTQDAYSIFSIPMTCEQPEFVGAVTEFMAAESYRRVTPAYYETALKIKYARDEATSQMLDIIRDGAVFDFAFVNSNGMNNIIHIFRELAAKKSGDFVSLYEKNEAKYQKALDKIIDAYKDLDG